MSHDPVIPYWAVLIKNIIIQCKDSRDRQVKNIYLEVDDIYTRTQIETNDNGDLTKEEHRNLKNQLDFITKRDPTNTSLTKPKAKLIIQGIQNRTPPIEL